MQLGLNSHTLDRRRIIIALVGLALTLRVAALVARGAFEVPAHVGAEAGVVAHAVAEGRGFVTPFGGDSPSTHLPPVYPLLLAMLIRVQEALGLAGAAGTGGAFPHDAFVHFAALVLNVIASCALPVLAVKLADAAGFPRGVGTIAGVLMCVCPEALRAVGLVWDEAIFATLAAAVLLLIVRSTAGTPPTVRAAATLGGLNGMLSLLNPAMALALPAAFLAAARAAGTPWRRIMAMAGAIALLTLVGGLPWHIRNVALVDPPAHVFVRGNFWLEVWSNLNPIHFTPRGPRVAHPWRENGQERLEKEGRPITEQDYFAWCRERALETPVFREPAAFVGHVARQVDGFWVGTAEAARWRKSGVLFFIAQGIPAIFGILGWMGAGRRTTSPVIAAMVALLVVFPLPYYLTGGAARYRHPIDIVIYLGAASALYGMIEFFSRLRLRR